MIVENVVRTSFSHLKCSQTGEVYDKHQIQTFSRANKPLLAVYNFKEKNKNKLLGSSSSMWRYRALLPVEQEQHIISLGEGMTPLHHLVKAGPLTGLEQLYLKDEAANPTGSFKARGISAAISMAVELGIEKCVIPTAGNAGGALSAYCAKAGIEAHIYMPKETPSVFQKECQFYGAAVTIVDGNISDCAQKIKSKKKADWFDVSTLKEPYRLEGKKTMGFEIAEQLGWKVPDVIIYPTGGGTGLIGIWKAFMEMEKLGWVGSKKPRMVAVQTKSCWPIVKAFFEGKTQADFFQNAGKTIANGLRVPAAFGDELILRTLYESSGTAIALEDEAILAAIKEMARIEGILLSPEGAATWAACQQLFRQGWITPGESVVLLNTGSLYKYMEHF